MNRNEVLEVLSKAMGNAHSNYLGNKSLQKKHNYCWDYVASEALSALEAIMERDGLKLLASDSYPKNAADLDKVMYRTHFDQAKCKLKGGE